MDASQYADLFLAESREHLSAVNQRLLEWERDPASREPLTEIFRAMHTLKGMAHTMGYTRVGDLAHRAENLLDLLCKGARPVTDATLEVLFRAADTLEHAIEAAVEGKQPDPNVAKVSRQLDKAAGVGKKKAARKSILGHGRPVLILDQQIRDALYLRRRDLGHALS